MGCSSSKPTSSNPPENSSTALKSTKTLAENGARFSDVEYVFMDCDDTLYQNDWQTAKRIKDAIQAYCAKEFDFDDEKAFELYKTYGTCLRGLLELKILP